MRKPKKEAAGNAPSLPIDVQTSDVPCVRLSYFQDIFDDLQQCYTSTMDIPYLSSN